MCEIKEGASSRESSQFTISTHKGSSLTWKHEGNLAKAGQEPVEKDERHTDLAFPQKGRGEARCGDDVGQPAQAHIDVDARRVQDPSPLSSCPVWFDEEDLTGKPPRGGQILLALLAASLAVFEVSGKRGRELTVRTGVADEGVDVRAYDGRRGVGTLGLRISAALLS
jgi:hypothetical protein